MKIYFVEIAVQNRRLDEFCHHIIQIHFQKFCQTWKVRHCREVEFMFLLESHDDEIMR